MNIMHIFQMPNIEYVRRVVYMEVAKTTFRMGLMGLDAP